MQTNHSGWASSPYGRGHGHPLDFVCKTNLVSREGKGPIPRPSPTSQPLLSGWRAYPLLHSLPGRSPVLRPPWVGPISEQDNVSLYRQRRAAVVQP